jgi:alkylation response protein AidB-like acyl-CoA dehydrogenase
MAHSTLAAVHDLAPLIATHADEAERERRLARPGVDALVHTGVFRLLVPPALGGAGASPLEFCEVIEAVSTVDGSTGWCVMINGCYGHFAAVGQAEGLVRAGRAFLTETLRDAWTTVTGGAALSWEQRGLLWLASTQAATQAVQAVELLFTAAGASAVYASTGLERCLRDVRTAAQHICVTPTNFEIAGQLTLGLDVHQSVWSIDDRVDG